MLKRIIATAAIGFTLPAAAEDHRISVRGGIAYSQIGSADIAEDKALVPVDGAINGLLYLPDSPGTYNCAASYKAQLLPTATKESGGGKPGCQATPSTAEVEYRMFGRFRLLYSRIYMPRADYNSQFVTPLFSTASVGFGRTIYAYAMRHGRSTAGAGYLHPVLDSLRMGPTVRGVKEFSLYTLTPSALLLQRAGSVTAGAFTFQSGRRERILSGAVPGFDLELDLLKNLTLILTYQRYILKGGMSESRATVSTAFVSGSGTGSVAFSGPTLEFIEARLRHSGSEAGLAMRFGSGVPGAFHFGFLKRKHIRSYDSYNRFSSANIGNLTTATTNLLYVNGLYTSSKYVQTEKYVEMKLELGLGF